MAKTINSQAAARRVAAKTRRANLKVLQDAFQNEFQQYLARVGPEQTAKLRHDALVAANKRLLPQGASADEVVRAAQELFEESVRFLVGGK